MDDAPGFRERYGLMARLTDPDPWTGLTQLDLLQEAAVVAELQRTAAKRITTIRAVPGINGTTQPLNVEYVAPEPPLINNAVQRTPVWGFTFPSQVGQTGQEKSFIVAGTIIRADFADPDRQAAYWSRRTPPSRYQPKLNINTADASKH